MNQIIVAKKMKARRLVDSGGAMAESGGFITKAGMALVAEAIMAADGKDAIQDANLAIPEGLPQPDLYRLTLMPVRQIKKVGSLFMPPEWLDVQNWTHLLWKVAAVGDLVYRGPAYHGFPEDELQAQTPKVGDLVLSDPKHPRRYRYKGILFVVVNDDQIWSRVDPERIDGLEFQGGKL